MYFALEKEDDLKNENILKDKTFTEYVSSLSQMDKAKRIYRKYYPMNTMSYLNRIVGTKLLIQIPKEQEYIEKMKECFNSIILKIKQFAKIKNIKL